MALGTVLASTHSVVLISAQLFKTGVPRSSQEEVMPAEVETLRAMIVPMTVLRVVIPAIVVFRVVMFLMMMEPDLKV